ncbi:MAG: histidine kinase [Cyclobacteriaceae bacterium]
MTKEKEPIPGYTWADIIKVLIIIVVANFAIFLLICPSCMTTIEGFRKNYDDILYSIILSIGLWLGNGYISEVLDKAISWIEQPVKRLVVGLVAMFGYSTLYTLALAVVLFYFVYPQVIEKEGWGIIFTILDVPLMITLGITAFLTSRGFLLSWRQSAIEASHAKAQAMKFQYDALKSQLNPHFLFNSMNALTNLIYEDQEASVRFVKQLSKVYRYVLDTRENEVVDLQEELAFLDSYIFLQKIRLEAALEVSIADNLRQAEGVVPPMSLQLLVENAIKHNIASQGQPLHIVITCENGYIRIANRLQAKAAEDRPEGLGLVALKQRYQNLTDKPVTISDGQEDFIVNIPLLTLHS